MDVERCDECGFDGAAWTDAAAVGEIGALHERFTDALERFEPAHVTGRPLPDTWSVAEYVDHVREVLFGMRFLLDTAVTAPGSDLGDPPEPRFDPTPRAIEVADALAGLGHQAAALSTRLDALDADEWSATVVVGGDVHDAHWIARHAVHDSHHHLLDIERLRSALG